MKSLSIKSALLSISALTLVLSGIAGFAAVKSLGTINGGANELYDDIIPGIFYAEEMNVAIGDLRIASSEHFLASTEQEQADAETDIAASIKNFNQMAEGYGKTIPLDATEELAAMDEIMNNVTQYIQMNDKFIEDSRASNDVEAGNLFRGEMDTVYNKIGRDLDQLMDKNQADSDTVNNSNDETYASARNMVIANVSILVAISLTLMGFAIFGVIRPIMGMVSSMLSLADGNMETHIPFTDRNNELGKMAKAVQIFRDNMIRARELEAEQEKAKAMAEAERRSGMLKMADDLESAVGGVVSVVSSASTEMQSSAQTLSATAEEASRQATTVASATEQASANVQTVAAATEELSCSIAEITRQVAQSTNIANEAVVAAQQTDQKMSSLVEIVRQIDSIVQMINDIAGQTNLLALNATIEAARAGDAGKGFAVVASEVKNLAAETGKATEEIVKQISEIQSATQESSEAIKRIGQTINNMSSITQSIAAAVEEQGAATQNIAENVQQAAAGTDEVARNIVDVSRATGETGTAATQILGAAGELAKQSTTLKDEVGGFLLKLRAA